MTAAHTKKEIRFRLLKNKHLVGGGGYLINKYTIRSVHKCAQQPVWVRFFSFVCPEAFAAFSFPMSCFCYRFFFCFIRSGFFYDSTTRSPFSSQTVWDFSGCLKKNVLNFRQGAFFSLLSSLTEWRILQEANGPIINTRHFDRPIN